MAIRFQVYTRVITWWVCSRTQHPRTSVVGCRRRGQRHRAQTPLASPPPGQKAGPCLPASRPAPQENSEVQVTERPQSAPSDPFFGAKILRSVALGEFTEFTATCKKELRLYTNEIFFRPRLIRGTGICCLIEFLALEQGAHDGCLLGQKQRLLHLLLSSKQVLALRCGCHLLLDRRLKPNYTPQLMQLEPNIQHV